MYLQLALCIVMEKVNLFFSILGKKGSFSIYVKYFKYFKSVIKTEMKIYVQR